VIAYMVQCHTEFAQVARLLEWIYHEDDLFILSIDRNTQDDLAEIALFLERENVVIAPSHKITWGGASIVQATLSSIREALNNSTWEYFINLSAFDVPLITRAALGEALAHHAKSGVFNFVSDFGPLEWEPRVWSGEFDRRLLITAPGAAWIELNGNLVDLMSSDMQSHTSFKPVTDAHLRVSFNVDEGSDGKLLACRPLYRFEAEERQDFSSRSSYRYGRQWVILHREICELLFASEIATTIYQNIKHIFIPDEIFFQTLFGATANSSPKRGLIKNNQRYFLGAPERITDRNFAEVRASGAWFARKLVVLEATDVIAFTNRLTSKP
jgi:Core-2/I-Branching enzyme